MVILVNGYTRDANAGPLFKSRIGRLNEELSETFNTNISKRGIQLCVH